MSFGKFFVILFAIIGLSIVVGLLTKCFEKNPDENEEIINTGLRGFVWIIIIVFPISIIIGIIQWLCG